MHVTLVHVHVKPEFIDRFIEATIENARNSIQEPGVIRFDCIQQSDDPTYFVLIEAYRDDQAPARHKDTMHYQKWRDAVADMMAEPRQGIRYGVIYPDERSWG